MTQTIDPIYSPSVLRGFALASDDFDMDALAQEHGLQGKVGNNPKTAAIILAGGSGERFGKEGGKQLVEIAHKPILTWSSLNGTTEVTAVVKVRNENGDWVDSKDYSVMKEGSRLVLRRASGRFWMILR